MRFITAHSSLPSWQRALDALASQVARERARVDTITRPNLGLVYVDPRYATLGDELLNGLRERLGVAHWVGGVVPGVFASGEQGIESCGVALMLLQLAQRDFRVFSGRKPLPPLSRVWRGAHSVLAHGDAEQPDLDELVAELGERCDGHDVWGGIVSPGCGAHFADAVLQGGVSGVAFSSRVSLLGGLSHGMEAVGPARTVTRCADNVVYALDGQPALGALLDDLGEPRRRREHEQWRELVPSLRDVVVGLSWPEDAPSQAPAGAPPVLRGLIGIDPGAQGVALAAELQPGMQLRFCRRQTGVSLRDLLRLCTEVREELEQRREARQAAGHSSPADGGPPVRGAVFATCAARRGTVLHAQWQLLHSQLGEVPLIGFEAAGEFSGASLQAYSSVLRVFAQDVPV
ncbi:FIST N-terminal domain-containing protein [Thiomonas sp.]|jgi:small ligand-binding sensory domain FIST|uniref:FIST N-terminal domain-containing protein n=1 Tax=Thiomonas sp. TaxID=2047785 RepID=UPI00261B001D|nr:FIST N-terminal domain-containing protein [Thiomonas sp.]